MIKIGKCYMTHWYTTWDVEFMGTILFKSADRGEAFRTLLEMSLQQKGA